MMLKVLIFLSYKDIQDFPKNIAATKRRLIEGIIKDVLDKPYQSAYQGESLQMLSAVVFLMIPLKR